MAISIRRKKNKAKEKKVRVGEYYERRRMSGVRATAYPTRYDR
ncbi:MAG: hypothetical protein ACW97A_11525 [Candidatus Thorarchaeota archaeon]